MSLDGIFEESEHLAAERLEVLDFPLFDDSARVRVSDLACSMSLEHWSAVRALLAGGLLPSGLVVHRSQFEFVVRSVWILYAATDDDISKLSADLTFESEQAAKNAPQIADMMQALSAKAPPQAHDALRRFKDNSWRALNSYAHAGIHPLRRHEQGYPLALLRAALQNANGLGFISGMQAAVLAGRQPLQRQLLDLAAKHPTCMPPLL
jgi:hypothetical protein